MHVHNAQIYISSTRMQEVRPTNNMTTLCMCAIVNRVWDTCTVYTGREYCHIFSVVLVGRTFCIHVLEL